MSVFFIRKMTMDDLEEVVLLDCSSFNLSWSRNNFIFELTENQTSRCFVGVVDQGNQEKIVGFLVVWLLIDVVHIATIAIDDDFRRRHFAEKLIWHGLEDCFKEGALEATLEVRKTNLDAQALYSKLGFEIVVERPNYYSDTKEGALIMTLSNLNSATIQAKLNEHDS